MKSLSSEKNPKKFKKLNALKFLFNFLKAHFFYGKGINHDLQKLFQKFNYDFKNNIEDIARTRLEPYGHSINFVQMTLQFAGKPTAEFKDVRITKSNWDLPELSMRQVLYAAFDVVAISVAYPNFPPPMEMIHQKKKSKTSKKLLILLKLKLKILKIMKVISKQNEVSNILSFFVVNKT